MKMNVNTIFTMLLKLSFDLGHQQLLVSHDPSDTHFLIPSEAEGHQGIFFFFCLLNRILLI